MILMERLSPDMCCSLLYWIKTGIPSSFHDLELVNYHPLKRHGDALFHGRGSRAYHPAVFVTLSHLVPYFLSDGALPDIIKLLFVKVAHDHWFIRTIAGHNVAIWIHKKHVSADLTGQRARIAAHFVGQAHVEIGSEPVLRLVGSK